MLDIYHHRNSKLHDMGRGHLEAPERISIIHKALKEAPFETAFHQAQIVNPNDILRVHDPSLHEALKASQAKGGHEFTSDTIANKYTYQAALTAAGGSIQTALNAKIRPTFGMLRPPGHHATKSSIMGFCFYNNISIAAAYLQHKKRRKIAIIDIDCHHGNGTQDIFAEDPEVLYASIHADPSVLFPGTGYATEVGTGEGKGRSLNIPLPAGTGDQDYLFAFDTLITPIVWQFRPEIILVSLGFDALKDDPYGALGLTPRAFLELGARIGSMAELLCNNRVGLFLEGGYNYQLMGQATVNFFSGLLNPSAVEKDPLDVSKVVQEIVFNVRSIHRSYWYGI